SIARQNPVRLDTLIPLDPRQTLAPDAGHHVEVYHTKSLSTPPQGRKQHPQTPSDPSDQSLKTQQDHWGSPWQPLAHHKPSLESTHLEDLPSATKERRLQLGACKRKDC